MNFKNMHTISCSFVPCCCLATVAIPNLFHIALPKQMNSDSLIHLPLHHKLSLYSIFIQPSFLLPVSQKRGVFLFFFKENHAAVLWIASLTPWT